MPPVCWAHLRNNVMPKLNNVQLVIVERRTLLREGLASLLSDTKYKAVASLATVSELPSVSLLATRPTLIILGLWDGIAEAVKAAREARSLPPDTKVVVVANLSARTKSESFSKVVQTASLLTSVRVRYLSRRSIWHSSIRSSS